MPSSVQAVEAIQYPARLRGVHLEQLHSAEATALSGRNYYRRAIARLEAELAEKRELLTAAEARYEEIRRRVEQQEEPAL
jgi:molecular chaperone GrpE (heat shock protein)